MLRFLITLLGVSMLIPDPVLSDESFLERFALAENREEVLKELIPGTQEYYFYHCLHFQHTGRFDEVDRMLRKWIDRHKRGSLIDQIQYRQALLTYDKTPQKTLEFIRRQNKLQFNHQQRRPDARPELPTSLDQSLIARPRLTQRALQRHTNLAGFETTALRWLVKQNLNPNQRRDLLSRLDRPDVERLPELLVADLRHPKSGGFGSLSIHRNLLLDQLQKCARLMPELKNNAAFVNEWIQRLCPGNDTDMRYDRDERDRYLTRLWEFVRPLPPVHNSLKAHVLYQRLAFDRQRGRYDKATFMEYVRLPRRTHYMDSDYMKREPNRRFPCDLNADYRQVTTMSRVGNDEPLVREYLLHLLVHAENAAEFEPYLNDTWLKHVFAEAKIVNGVGDAEKWYSLLPPETYRKLRDRIDIDFAATNQTYFAPDDAVSLDVFVKNVPQLIVKVFEINAANFYRDNDREVNTDINLDGLVAGREQIFDYAEAPLRRMKRHFEFPQLNKRGTYVIDFIGNGQASRALIRKGRLHFVSEATISGQRFIVLDEQNEQVRDATLQLGGQSYSADEDGSITIPYSTRPGKRSIILSSGSYVAREEFLHAGERYGLNAGIFVDRESLIRRSKATVIIRPQLTVNGIPVSTAALSDVKLTISSTDQDGIAASTTVDDFELFEDRESLHEFSVPQRMASIGFTLTAKTQSSSAGKEVSLSASRTFEVNGTGKSDLIADVYLGRTDAGFILDVLGRTGEARQDVAVAVRLKHAHFTQVVNSNLKSDRTGRILLGPLRDIETLSAQLPNGVQRTWSLAGQGDSAARVIHAAAGDDVRIRAMISSGEFSTESVSVLELRGNEFSVDRFSSAVLKDGFIVLSDLAAGDYRVDWTDGAGNTRRVLVRLAEGTKNGDHIVGTHRKLQTPKLPQLQIGDMKIADGKLQIRLTESSPFARVHLFANTFRGGPDRLAHLGSVSRPGVTYAMQSRPRSLFVEGRNIGDEYRYVLERRNAEKFPGNMNTRPGLLLNPWDVRRTSTSTQEAQAGDNFAPKPAAQAPAADRAVPGGGKDGQNADGDDGRGATASPTLDFLSDAAMVEANLLPGEDGMISIDPAHFDAHQEIHVVAVDPINTVWRTFALPPRQAKSIDLRLAHGLDAEKHFSQQKHISALKAGEQFEVADISTSRMVTYGSLDKVFQLFATLNPDANFSKFRFVLDWPELKAERKRALYSEFACHELNFFLFRKDPEFFKSVVRPYLANKFDKTFLDEWLLGMDVSRHVGPWEYGRLNTFERILLARRLENERRYGRRFITDQFKLLPPNASEDDRLFATTLSTGGFDDDEKGPAEGAFLGGGGGGGAPAAAARSESLMELEDAAGAAFGRDALRMQTETRSKKKAVRKLEQLRRSRGRGGRRGADMGLQLFRADKSRQQQLFRQVEKTMEWAENNYYRIELSQQTAELIDVNAFWNDYALHEDGPFLSTNLARATGNFAEMMLALSVLDLPFRAGEHKAETEDSKLTFRAGSPVIIVHEQIRPAIKADDKSPVLVGQNFFRKDARYRTENGKAVEQFVTDEFLIHTVYSGQVVVTNPSSSHRTLNALVQIPLGAVPVAGSKYTRSVPLTLGAFETKTVEYSFYFPAAGDFTHYPAHVSRDRDLVAQTEAFRFHVVAEPTSIDKKSWEYVSQYASAEDVLEYLDENNLHRTDVSKIAWRMKDRAFFDKVVQLLADNHIYNETLWSYAVKHDHKSRLGEYLRNHAGFAAHCGPVLESSLLTIDPVERGIYEHFEYKPLVNARAHKLGVNRQILNDRFRAQHTRLMQVLSYRSSLSDRDRFSVSYYLLLQDRIGDALAQFARVNPDNLPSKLQHDYFVAYADFYTEGLDKAKKIVAQYAEYPVDRWQKMFAAMKSQIDEIESGRIPESERERIERDDRERSIAALAAADCSFDVAVEKTSVKLAFKNLETVQVNYYLMDIELLFSRNPFVSARSGHFSHVKPNAGATIELPQDEPRVTFELPAHLHNKNVLVEVVGRGKTQTAAYFSNSLGLQIMDNYGRLQVTSLTRKSPLPGAYVKAYAKMKDGSVRFFKDGYTDLRGQFDYASLSTNQLDQVERFSLLILSDEHGAIVREAKPPTR